MQNFNAPYIFVKNQKVIMKKLYTLIMEIVVLAA